MLKNAYLGAKIGFDTAANELSKVGCAASYQLYLYLLSGTQCDAMRCDAMRICDTMRCDAMRCDAAARHTHLNDLYTESGQTSQSSLSAASKPIFEPKIQFFDIIFLRDLQDFHTSAQLQIQKRQQQKIQFFTMFTDFIIS